MNLQKQNAENINLVSPTIYANKIADALKIAKSKGLNIPIIYNSNGYEKVETLSKLEGLIDVYLPDFKYYDDDLAFKFSKIKNYSNFAKSAIMEMERQVGVPKFNQKGMIKKGLIIRHLIMPGAIQNTKDVLKWLKSNMEDGVYISVMTQFFPSYKAMEYKEINRKITKEEYDEIENYIYKIGIENGYMQDMPEENEEQYVPDWDF